MTNNNVVLDLLRFELEFLEAGGYGRSPRTPWLPTRIFKDSPTCLNFNDPAHPHSCQQCFLTQFVPEDKQAEAAPCRHIPLTDPGETVEDFYRCGTQIEMEDALKKWLKKTIERLEEQQTLQPTNGAAS
jgi:hypothetical protein